MSPYRVYIAAASSPDQIERARAMAARCRDLGIEVVSTWTDVIASVGVANPREATTDQRRQWSAQDLWEVARAHALWLLFPPAGQTSFGAGVELGSAYARARLIVSSGDTRRSIFPALGMEYATDEDALEGLRLVAVRRMSP